MSGFVFGTWQCAPSDGFWCNQDPLESERLLGQAVRMGIRSFDTAQSYGKGRAEQLLGKVLSRFPNEGFRVDTKIMPTTKDPLDLVRLSLSRLRVQRLNRLYLHWPRTGFNAAMFIEGMAKCKDIGLVEKVGICNAPLDYLGNLCRELAERSVALDCLQVPVSLLWTRDLDDTLAFCHDHGIEVVAYSPMGMGLLSGKYEKADALDDARANLFCFKEPCFATYGRLLGTLKEVAFAHNVSCSTIALAWTASCGVDSIILGARSLDQLKANVSALDIHLDEGEFLALKQAGDELAACSRQVCDNIFSYKW